MVLIVIDCPGRDGTRNNDKLEPRVSHFSVKFGLFVITRQIALRGRLIAAAGATFRVTNVGAARQGYVPPRHDLVKILERARRGTRSDDEKSNRIKARPDSHRVGDETVEDVIRRTLLAVLYI